MLASLHPTSPTTDKALKDLLDQRARSTRHNSLSFSQRSDSPSVYSRGDYSPNNQTPRSDPPTRLGYLTSVIGQSTFDDPEDVLRPPFTASPLEDGDLSSPAADDEDEDEDDVTSFISAPTPKPAFYRGDVSTCDLDSRFETSPTEDGEEDPRMSMLGPKMRFVSRAPWEMSEDQLLEEDDEDAGGASDSLSLFGGKISSWRSRDPEKTSSQGLGLSTFRSRSPGPPSAIGKKSAMGMNFGLRRHKMPEPQTESPYGPYLGGSASQSHSAILNTLASFSRSSQSSDNLAYKHSLSQAHSDTNSPASPASHFPPLLFSNAQTFRAQNASNASYDDSVTSSNPSDSPPPSARSFRSVHPYADLSLLPAAGPPPPIPLPQTPRKNRDQSDEEPDKRISVRRASESPLASPQATNPRKFVLPPAPASRTSHEGDEETMLPFTVMQGRAVSSAAPPSPRSMMTFGDQPGSPMRNLITLEQARARAQSVQQAPSWTPGGADAAGSSSKTIPSSTLVAGLGLAPGVVVEDGIRNQAQRSGPGSSDSSWAASLPPPNQNQQPRPRNVAATGKLGNSSGPDGNVIPPKVLKHKKSAFMKLFQGGRDKERDKEPKDLSLPAPAPPVRAKSTPPRAASTDSSAPSSEVHHIKRVPPPLPLSVVVTSPTILPSSSPPRAQQGTSAMRLSSPPRHRQASAPSPLFSNYNAQGADQDTPTQSQSRGSQPSDFPRSAPPSQTTFTTLSLRPMSTIFSDKFPDLLYPSSPPPVNPPENSSRRPSYPSPVTPGFSYSRSTSISTASDYPVTPTSAVPLPGHPAVGPVSNDDPSTVIAALQEQIINSRKTWQRQIWELEGQVKDLKVEVEELRNTGQCETCGKARREGRIQTPVAQNCSVVDRPRPRMGGTARSMFGGGSDM